MNTTQNSESHSSRFSSLRGLGRGIVVSSAVALMGVGSMSGADASAAGVAHGVRYAGPVATSTARANPADASVQQGGQLVVRSGKVSRS